MIFHHKYDALIREISKTKNKIYEEAETSIIIRHLEAYAHPMMLDIGANIGLMSLNVCHYLGRGVVCAFEPGPIQFDYLVRNVMFNDLRERILPFNLALSSQSGLIDFHVHPARDGIIDTGRAGKSKKIKVKSITLDDWWIQYDKPEIHFIKIDTEGAEVQILNNACALIRRHRPPILIEICYLNYENYGLQFEDYIYALNNYNYSLYDLKKQNVITEENYPLFRDQFYFLAFPNSM
jgi:FkbM family methyltransferase